MMARLEPALGQVLDGAEFTAWLTGLGLASLRMSAAEFRRFLQRQLSLWVEHVKLVANEPQ
jgi:tripartite-type tricarboxylate transporter receptor subunit TctC